MLHPIMEKLTPTKQLMGERVFWFLTGEKHSHLHLREGFFEGFTANSSGSIPSLRQEVPKLGADAGQFPMPERINVALALGTKWTRED